MNKPTIPNEVADLIEDLRNDSFSNEDIVHLRNDVGSIHRFSLNSISCDTLMAALVNGYEREMTEEQRHQKIKDRYELYRSCAGNYDTGREDEAHADGIRYTLNMLDIKIEGVNA